ncbi:MAG: transglycosylase SLT domain-containing protein [Bdellovibrionaceae bacterium]|nr:transglycosylase SLT domain-containing protein [Pseudobdellovibrionaceae bacterium]NUM57789.1 transglycosylase SLT domain-containing protein [Pseudobdellovibrionaceae bacterium]
MLKVKNKVKFLLLTPFFLFTYAEAVVLNFPKDLEGMKFTNLYELNVSEKINKKETAKLHPLSHWRFLEINKQYDECLSKAPSFFQKNKTIQGWIMVVWSQCQVKSIENKKYDKLGVFLTNLDKNSNLLEKGPWKNSLVNQTQKIILMFINNEKGSDFHLQQLLPEMKKFIFKTFSVWNNEVKKWAQGQLEKEFPSLNPIRNDKNIVLKQATGQVSNELSNLTIESNVKAEEALSVDSKSGDNFVIENLLILNKKDKLTNLEPFLKKLSIDKFKVDRETLFDLLNKTYRKMEYGQIIQLSNDLDKYFQYSQNYPNFLIMVARSYHYIGDYSRALSTYKRIIDDFSESDELQEALFNSGLVQLRQKNFFEAKKYFETLYSLKKDKYDITGRYWWLKTLELTGDKRLLDEKNKFVHAYPYSYFGVKIQLEENKKSLDLFSAESKLPHSQWELMGELEANWFRFKELSERGWILEAQQELQNFTLPTNPLNQYYFTQILAKASQHPLVVRVMNQLLETSQDIRSEEMIRSMYPMTYFQKINSEALKYKLDPFLIMSLIRQESSFGLKALSTSNAAGLMQMIQPTALEVASKLKLKIQFPEDLYKPDVNIPMGTYYYSEVLKDFKMHIPLALASYNAGPHKIKSFLALRSETKNLMTEYEKLNDWENEIWIEELPWAETTGYVKSILRNSLVYRLLQGKPVVYKYDFWREFLL